MAAVAELRRYERGAMPPEPKSDRPKTLGEARERINEVFEVNGWDASERRVYLASLGIWGDSPKMISAAEIRIVVADLEKSRMILFRD